ncbi:cupin domain-containing protein [Ornithinibacillus sp. 179-J 7C1 HS]|uniref:cupin domain-containing protein n=1 Tax=Ornithinibacillus sp. 179-J 7C1 HS TaxID=3142384 RepID=UPI0039A39CA7
MSSKLDYTSPSTQFSFDVNKSTLFKKDNQNYINILGIQQLNSLENVSLLDIFLGTNNVVEPHYHQNAAELVYCISGSATVSILNPFTKEIQNYTITPGQVANVPQGWWHYEVALVDDTHLLAIFDAPTPEVILGSDILKFTPASIMSHTYCIDKNLWQQATAPVKPTTYIGPYKDCNGQQEHTQYQQKTTPYNQPRQTQNYQPITYIPYPYYWGNP